MFKYKPDDQDFNGTTTVEFLVSSPPPPGFAGRPSEPHTHIRKEKSWLAVEWYPELDRTK